MHLLDLPLELFQAILCRAIQARGIKRGLRLRLVNTIFAKEVIQALFTFRLLDSYFSSFKSCQNFPLPSFAASYLGHRVLNESNDGLPVLLCIRSVAERLCQESTETTDGRDFRLYVKQLCRSVVENRHPHSMAGIFRARILKRSNYEAHVYVAAVYTQTMPIVRRWIADGNNACESSWIFGHPYTYAVERGSHELLELLMSDPVTGVNLNRRCNLLRKVVRAGRAETTRFVFNFGVQQYPWRFSREMRGMYENRSEFWLATLRTPSKEVWDFIMGLREIHPVVGEFDQKEYTFYLDRCASEGWADMAVHLLDLGAWVNGTSPHDVHGRPLVCACKGGHRNVVKVLLAHGADTSGAVEAASQHGHLAIVQILLKHGANTTGALEKAAAGGYRDIVELLLDHGADPNNGSPNSLVYAIELEHVALFRLLMERGAMMEEETRAECVRRAKEKGFESMSELLRENGVDLIRCETVRPS